jgi:hypothetical protein
MSQYIEKVASPQVLNYAWTFVQHTHGDWHCGLSVAEMQPAVIRHIGDLSEQLLAGTYRPEPMCCRYATSPSPSLLRRGAKTSPVRGGQMVCLSTVRDQLVQHAILSVLEPLAEVTLHQGFGVSSQSVPKIALKDIRDYVNQGYTWLGMMRIADYFETLSHSAVLKSLHQLCGDKALVNVVRLSLESCPVEFRPAKNKGLPPSMVLSSFLSELFMYNFDSFLQDKGVLFIRVEDEIVVFAPQVEMAQWAVELVEKRLRKLGLILEPEKTLVVQSSSQYKFLGKRLPNSEPRFQMEKWSQWARQQGTSLKEKLIIGVQYLSMQTAKLKFGLLKSALLKRRDSLVPTLQRWNADSDAPASRSLKRTLERPDMDSNAGALEPEKWSRLLNGKREA